ncbi:hypothetical protein AB0J35_54440 [Nonomuraea angiospora]|uniref:hypothetical protein n=1 Tax=Nonomuraea angiospora TaxID=46172 RepID=UPI0034332E5E
MPADQGFDLVPDAAGKAASYARSVNAAAELGSLAAELGKAAVEGVVANGWDTAGVLAVVRSLSPERWEARTTSAMANRRRL